MPNGLIASEMLDDGGLRFLGLLLWMDADVDERLCLWHYCQHRPFRGRGVEPDDGQRRTGPKPVGNSADAKEGLSCCQAGHFAILSLVYWLRALPFVSKQTLDGRTPSPIMEGGKGMYQCD